MAQRVRKRKAFEMADAPAGSNEDSRRVYDTEDVGGVFGFFRDFGVRESIESILIAVVLALMFRTFQAEAFIIPTGSMASSLQGQHMDVQCDKCSYWYRTGATYENSTWAANQRIKVSSTYCPICNHELELERGGLNVGGQRKFKAEHESNSGDRILVNKFIYDFVEPKRWDVIVFKYPNNGKQNYIKRLVGLPNEKLSIEGGDIYSFDDQLNKTIIRKPPHKIRVMMQLIDDTHYIPEELTEVDWPLRWQPWAKQMDSWEHQTVGKNLEYFLKPSESTEWLSYRHLRPDKEDWESIENGELSLSPNRQLGQLITDYYAYNDADLVNPAAENNFRNGAHWVGDLIMQVNTEVISNSGTIRLKLVEGGTSYICSIDVASGTASLSSDNQKVQFKNGDEVVEVPEGQTRLKGPGKYVLMFANVDDQLHLWINNRLVEFDAATFVRDEIPVPKWSPSNPGDAEPAAIGGENIELKLSRLRVYRDIYYTSVGGTNQAINPPTSASELDLRVYPESYQRQVHSDPKRWADNKAVQMFSEKKGKQDPMFVLDDDQLLPMGDNSPHSQDGRIWRGPRYLHKEYLLGRAMFIYWPHTVHSPIPRYTPNFWDMGFIR